MSHTYRCYQYHLISATKDRYPYITESLKERLYPYIGGIIRQHGGVLLNINGMEDHVHILAGLPPTLCVAEAMKVIKGGSSWWINNELSPGHGFQWQPGYAGFTVSRSLVPNVRAYIRDQELHHSKRSFDDEMLVFLERHDLTPEFEEMLGPELLERWYAITDGEGRHPGPRVELPRVKTRGYYHPSLRDEEARQAVF